MAKASDALDCDEISGHGAAVAESVESCDTGAHQRRCIFRPQSIRNACQRLYRHTDIFRIAAVIADPRNLQFDAGHEIAAPARIASPTIPAKPSDSDSITGLPWLGIWPERIYYSGDLVA